MIATSCMQEGIAQKIIFHIVNIDTLVQGIGVSAIDEIYVDDIAYGITLRDIPLLMAKSIVVQDIRTGKQYILPDENCIQSIRNIHTEKIRDVQVATIDC